MRPFWLKLTAVGVGLLLAILLSECFFIGYYYWRDGSYLSVREKLQQEPIFHLFQLVGNSECSYAATLAPHPYLAFIHHTNFPCHVDNVNNIGLYGPDFPLTKDPDSFVIMLTGGSVASQVGRMASGSLEEVLNRRYQIGNKKFRVLNGALEAWKQPQQLIMLMLYGNAIDGVVTLDGFNEVISPVLVQHTARVDKPWKDAYLAANPHLTSHGVLLAAWINNKIYRVTRHDWVLGHSKLFYFLSHAVRGMLRTLVQTDEPLQRKQDLDHLFALPKTWSDTEKQVWNLDQHQRYVLMMHAIATQLNLKAAYFIQPVPAIGKTLTEEEQRVVGTPLSYTKQYLAMEERLLALHTEGVPVTSLTDIYADTNETLYVDQVHQKDDSPGYRLMVEKIADVLEVEWGLTRRD